LEVGRAVYRQASDERSNPTRQRRCTRFCVTDVPAMSRALISSRFLSGARNCRRERTARVLTDGQLSVSVTDTTRPGRDGVRSREVTQCPDRRGCGSCVCVGRGGGVLWLLGLGMAACNLTGARLGVHSALKHRSRFFGSSCCASPSRWSSSSPTASSRSGHERTSSGQRPPRSSRLGGSQDRTSTVTGTSRAATPDSPCNRTGQFGVVITWLERTGRDDARACSLQLTVTPPEEVRPMNAVSMWVLPLPVTVGRLT